MNLNVLKELVETLNRSSVNKLNFETKEFKLTLEKDGAPAAPAGTRAAAAAPVPAGPENGAGSAQQELGGKVVKSPIVGTFYAAAAPDKPPFVKVGQKVCKGDVLFIIESMKLMNEVNSEYGGTVAEIMAESGQPVEYGQPIMRIE